MSASPGAGHDDLHEWVSFDDPGGKRTWVFDVTFLTSAWTCIFGRGCQGVLTEPAEELAQGCCSYGAHFTGQADVDRIEAMATRLSDQQWQCRRVALRRGGAVKKSSEGNLVTRMVGDACIFLNRPGFPGGAGCALHRGALDAGERPLDWKPDVCWQLPLRLVEDSDEHGHITASLREWKRRDWGGGGFEFHWWCTDHAAAFVGQRPVYEALRDEIVAMVGVVPYDLLVAHLERRPGAAMPASTVEVFLPHPAVRRRVG